MTARPLQFFFGLLFVFACGLSLYAGLLRLPFGAWPGPPFDAATMSMDQVIFAFSLMPRVAVAILAGAMLGLSGALFQQLLRNPIADPSTLGISAGAQLAIVIATLFFPSVLDGNRAWVALAGAAAAVLCSLSRSVCHQDSPPVITIPSISICVFMWAIERYEPPFALR